MEQRSTSNKSSHEFNRRASLIVKNWLEKIKNRRQSVLPEITISTIEDKIEELNWKDEKLFKLTDEEKKRLVLKKGYAFK